MKLDIIKDSHTATVSIIATIAQDMFEPAEASLAILKDFRESLIQEMVKRNLPAVEQQVKGMLPKLIKEVGEELIVAGLKHLVAENFEGLMCHMHEGN